MSSTRMFGPVASGPKAQMERAASKSQSYFVWKNSPSFFLIERKGRSLENKNLTCTHDVFTILFPSGTEVSARDAHRLAGRKTKPGSLPGGCCLILCTHPADPSTPFSPSYLLPAGFLLSQFAHTCSMLSAPLHSQCPLPAPSPGAQQSW